MSPHATLILQHRPLTLVTALQPQPQVLLADLVRLCYQKYFKNAIGYLKSSPGGLTGSDITGLWISTDDEDVVAEVHNNRLLVLV